MAINPMVLDDEQVTPFVMPEEGEGMASGAEPKFEPAKAPEAPQAAGAVQPMHAEPQQKTPSFEETAEKGFAIQQDGKQKFHDQMRSFDTATTINRGMMMALSPGPGYHEKLADLQTREGLIKTAKADYELQHPLGSPESAHPGFGGKLMHVLGNVGNIAGTALVPGLMPSIPGSRLNIIGQRMQGEEEMQEAGKANLQASEAQAKTAAAAAPGKRGTPDEQYLSAEIQNNLRKGMNHEDAVTTAFKSLNQTKQDIKPEKPGSIDAMIAEATLRAQSLGTDPNADPSVKQLQQVKNGMGKPNQAEENKLHFQNLAQQIASQGLSTDPNALSKSIAKSSLPPEDKAFMSGYMATNPNPTTSFKVSVEGSEAKAANAAAGKSFTYTDEEGTHLVKGDKLPPGVESLPIKDPDALIFEAHTANVVQRSLNQIEQDVVEHPEIFNDATLRDILATATEEIDRSSAGILVHGTGGSVPVPSGLGHAIDSALQNGLDPKRAAALKQYIADYKSMKDKVITMQMALQGGKIGRGSAMVFKAIADQIPNGATPDGKTAMRQVDNLKQTQEELMRKYPEKYGDYTKVKPFDRGAASSVEKTVPTGARPILRDGRTIGYMLNGKRVDF